jgi:hypothetical protein
VIDFHLRERRRRFGAAEIAHHPTHNAVTCDRRQILFATWPERCLLAEMASCRYAVLRKWNAAGYYNQPSRFPKSNDDRDVSREYGRQGWCYAWPRTRRDSFQVGVNVVYLIWLLRRSQVLRRRYGSGLLRPTIVGCGIQLLRQRTDVLWHHWGRICSRHLSRCCLLPTTATHGSRQVPSSHHGSC